ncbi:MAG: tetratricopeptide repeat protein [Acidobacteriota bacterium]
MSQSRIEAFRTMLKDEPENAMIWYGLASEYIKQENLSEATVALRNVIRFNPDYTAAYQMLGSALMSQGQSAEACRVWNEGIAVANRLGAWKARQHLEGLLANVKPSTNSGFCNE